jgi:hypothetical protein
VEVSEIEKCILKLEGLLISGPIRTSSGHSGRDNPCLEETTPPCKPAGVYITVHFKFGRTCDRYCVCSV